MNLTDETRQKIQNGLLRRRVDDEITYHFWGDLDERDLADLARKYVTPGEINDTDLAAVCDLLMADDCSAIEVTVDCSVVIPDEIKDGDPPTPLDDHLYAVRAARAKVA